MINVGLIGFGLAGRAFHAQVFSRVPGMRLAAILQRTGDEAAKAHPDAKIVRSLDDLLAGRAFHAQVISRVPGMRLAAILQRTGDEAAKAHPDAKIVRSLDELLALP